MKKLIISMMMGMVLLTGCGSVDPGIVKEELDHNAKQEYLDLTPDLVEKFEKAGVDFYVSEEHYSLMPASYENEHGRVTFYSDDLIGSEEQVTNKIIIESQQDLSKHLVVKVLASIMEEDILSWVANQENQVIETGQKKVIQELLVEDVSYIFFEYFPGSEIRTLEFVWAPKPTIPMEFKHIAQDLEEYGLLITDYIEGTGGQTLIATNPDYYFLERKRYQRDKETADDKGQAATYKVMRDQSGNYSVQLFGYMEEALSYKTKVEIMPGLDEIKDLMGMDQKDFSMITENINEELSQAREILNDNLQRNYYLEGNVGEYHYTIMVPEGIGMYNFTVLIERKDS